MALAMALTIGDQTIALWLIGSQTIAFWLMDRVIVVDDNRDLGMLTSEILVEKGFRVNIAFDGETALARIKQEP
jgi:PleD family two-component response regulator